jgi:hypothetical protein
MTHEDNFNKFMEQMRVGWAGMETPCETEDHVRCAILVLDDITRQINDLLIEFSGSSSQLTASKLPTDTYKEELGETTEAFYLLQLALHKLGDREALIPDAVVTVIES